MHSVDSTSPFAWWQLVAGLVALVIWLATGGLRLNRAPEHRQRTGPGAGLLAFVAALVASIVAVMIAITFLGVDSDVEEVPLADGLIIQSASWVAQLAAIGIVLWIALAMTPKGQRSVGPDPRPPMTRAVLIGVIGLVLFWPMTIATASLASLVEMLITGGSPPMVAHDMLRQIAQAWPDASAQAFAVTVVIAPSIVEEVMYRGLLQQSLRRMLIDMPCGRWVAIVCTSLIFMLVHVGAVDAHGLAGLFVLSLGFGWVYMRTGRLIAPITMHVLFNLGNVVLVVS